MECLKLEGECFGERLAQFGEMMAKEGVKRVVPLSDHNASLLIGGLIGATAS